MTEQEPTPETSSEALKEEVRQIFVGNDAEEHPWALAKHDNGLYYKRVTPTPQILERLSVLLNLQRDQTLDALHDYFTKLTQASVRKGCLNHNAEQATRITDQESLIQLLMALLKSMPSTPPAKPAVDPATIRAETTAKVAGEGRPDYRFNYGDVREPGTFPLDGSTGLGDVSDGFRGNPDSNPLQSELPPPPPKIG